MPTVNESTTVYERGWIMRYRLPAQMPPQRITVFIHGWTGDENSMEIFARGLPSSHLQMFPRGPVSAQGVGFGWTSVRGIENSQLADFLPTAHELLKEIDAHLSGWKLQNHSFSVTGFSQGAAMAYILSLLYPQRVERIAALAGFLPALPDSLDLSAIKAKPVYIAHGTRDETIPVEEARKAAAFFNANGAEVDFCENNAGHKLPTICFAKLHEFLQS